MKLENGKNGKQNVVKAICYILSRVMWKKYMFKNVIHSLVLGY